MIKRPIKPPGDYPSFDQCVPPGGYCWWYADAMSDDGNSAITLIAFIGSVFSPYYFRAKKKPDVDPRHYCSLNVALYGRRKHRWAMTERIRDHVFIQQDQFQIGPSSVTCQDARLTFNIDERTSPIPSRIQGRVELNLHCQANQAFALDAKKHHYWWPVGARSSVNVDLTSPSLQWQGDAYTDMNWGSRPLEQDIKYWCWSRYQQSNHTYINYDVYSASSELHADPQTELALVIDQHGQVSERQPGPQHQLADTKIWRVPRHTRDVSTGIQTREAPVVTETIEDTPFYSRSLITSTINEQSCIGVHESLSLTRFRNPLVQAMLPFRMPRQIFPLHRRLRDDNAAK